MKKILVLVVLVALIVLVQNLSRPQSPSSNQTLGVSNVQTPKPNQSLSASNTFQNPLNLPTKNYADLPYYVQHTIDYLQANHFSRPEPGYVGGRIYTNYEKTLPWVSDQYYYEWDVHPKVNGVNRGVERLVTGQKGEVYFTNTHYGSAEKPPFYKVLFQ